MGVFGTAPVFDRERQVLLAIIGGIGWYQNGGAHLGRAEGLYDARV